MLYVFGFPRLGVAVSDLYFLGPAPAKGQEGPEHGVRLELRELDEGPLKGTVYSARPIAVGRPVWRVDLLESVEGRPGSFDRTHHHPVFTGWDPGPRVFVRELSADPIGWLAGRLADPDDVLRRAGARPTAVEDVDELHACVPEIVSCVERLLARVRAGELGTAPAGPHDGGVRAGWL